MGSALTNHDLEFINAQLPRLRAEYQRDRSKQTQQLLAVGKELSSKAAQQEWVRWAAEEFPGFD